MPEQLVDAREVYLAVKMTMKGAVISTEGEDALVYIAASELCVSESEVADICPMGVACTWLRRGMH